MINAFSMKALNIGEGKREREEELDKMGNKNFYHNEIFKRLAFSLELNSTHCQKKIHVFILKKNRPKGG